MTSHANLAGYQPGDRVILIATTDPYTRLAPGTRGTVTGRATTTTARSASPRTTAAPCPCCPPTATRSATPVPARRSRQAADDPPRALNIQSRRAFVPEQICRPAFPASKRRRTTLA